MRRIDWLHRVNLREEVQEIYLHRFLFNLALGMISIFLPLYILDHGYAVTTVFVFFILYYGAFIALSWPVAKLTARLGYKHVSLLASPVILLFYLSLRSVPQGSPLIYPVAFLGGAAFVTYWLGMNSEMARNSHSDRREKETGYFFSMPLLASVLSPFLGGLILSVYGFPALFMLTAVSVGVSFLPFAFSGEHSDGMDMDLVEFLGPARWIDLLTFLSQGVVSMGKKVVWPLYLALVIQGSVAIGGAGSLIALGSALTSILLGKISTPENRGRILMTSGAVAAVSFLAMSTVASPDTAFLVSFLSGVGYVGINLPIYTGTMVEAEKEDIIEYYAFREVGLAAGRILTLAVFALLFINLGQVTAFLYGLGFIAVSALAAAFFGGKIGG